MYKKSLKTKISETTSIPKDVSMGVPLLRMVGQNEIYIENFRGILEYTENLIRVQTKIGQIHVIGTRLEIEYYTNDEMKIVGLLEMLNFFQGG